MAQRRTADIIDFIDDYEEAARDYSEFGSMWAEMVFPDDFEALKAIYGRDNATAASPSRDRNRAEDRDRRSRC